MTYCDKEANEDLPLVSLVIVAREGFAGSAERLEMLMKATTFPCKLIYVDGGSPFRTYRKLRQVVNRHRGILIKSNRFLRPTQARNLGFREVATRYTVFLDNDVAVTDHWLEQLVACAEDTGADYVSPIVRQTIHGNAMVHVAGGENQIVTSETGNSLIESYAHMGVPFSEALEHTAREQISMAEFHTILVRTETLKQLGGLDERCSTAFEHNDLCLAVAKRGGCGWLEPASIVDYSPEAAGKIGNFTYCLLRWCRPWIEESLEAFCTKWELNPADPVFLPDLRSLHERRRLPLNHVRTVFRKVGGNSLVHMLDRFSDLAVNFLLRPYHEQKKLKVTVDRW